MTIHDIYRLFARHFRTKRMRLFWTRLLVTPRTRVLDVGGTEFNWRLLPVRPRLTIANLTLPEEARREVAWVVADETCLPFRDGAFDIVFSNSVIEHLGSLDKQQCFAAEIRRVARRYDVQTPNRRFPVEPRLLTPFIHWVPRRLQVRLLRNLTVWGVFTRPSDEQCELFLREIRLLDELELRRLFPDAQIWRARPRRLAGLSGSRKRTGSCRGIPQAARVCSRPVGRFEVVMHGATR